MSVLYLGRRMLAIWTCALTDTRSNAAVSRSNKDTASTNASHLWPVCIPSIFECASLRNPWGWHTLKWDQHQLQTLIETLQISSIYLCSTLNIPHLLCIMLTHILINNSSFTRTLHQPAPIKQPPNHCPIQCYNYGYCSIDKIWAQQKLA